MRSSRVGSSSSSSRKTSVQSPSTPYIKRQRRIYEDSPLSQSEVIWAEDPEVQVSPRRVPVRAKSSNQLVETPIRIVKRHVSSPVIGLKVKNLFNCGKTISELNEDTQLSKDDDDLFSIPSEDFDLTDDQLLAVLKKVDEEEQRQKQLTQTNPVVSAVASTDINFEDSFDDAILASIPLDELKKSDKANVEIFFNGGLSQIVNKTPPSKNFSKNKSVEHIGTKRPLERHNSLPQQPLANSTNVINASNGNNAPRKCTKEEIEAKKKAAQLRLAQSRQRQMKK